jgi:hypothetical protein
MTLDRAHVGNATGLAPVPSADLSDRSPWLFAYTRPVRPGWYEVRYWSERMRLWSPYVMRWWDGRAWRFAPHHVASDFAGHLRDQWRGRNRPE